MDPNLDILIYVALLDIVPLNHIVSQITQLETCPEMLTACGTSCIMRTLSMPSSLILRALNNSALIAHRPAVSDTGMARAPFTLLTDQRFMAVFPN
jgi:hypothetical protein